MYDTERIARALAADLRAEHDWLHGPGFRDDLLFYVRTIAEKTVLENADDNDNSERINALNNRALWFADGLGLTPSPTADVQRKIAQARKTLAKRAERKQFHDALVEAMVRNSRDIH